jgi:dipeptidyl aminopeptidase/acylaminoacyl peptidase
MQVLAAQGWVVAYCNPRGSSGRGMKFCNVIDGRWGTDDWSDVQALTSWMARRPYVDASRVGILGGSYGGFMTTWALGHTNRYKAGVTQRQAGDWHVMFGSSDFGFYDIYSLKCYPWEDPMAYHRASPNFYVKSIKSPLLIVHSEEDYRCPIAQGDALFTAMKVLDQAPCELVRFEGESHGLSRGGRPKNREERLKRIVDWFQRYL